MSIARCAIQPVFKLLFASLKKLFKKAPTHSTYYDSDRKPMIPIMIENRHYFFIVYFSERSIFQKM